MRQEFKHIRTVEALSLLNEPMFAVFVADAFRDFGYEVGRVPKHEDLGANFIISKAGWSIVVQAKQYIGDVGFDDVRRAHYAKIVCGADEAWIVSAHGFTSLAVRAAQNTGARLISGADLLRLIKTHTDPSTDPQQLTIPGMPQQLTLPGLHDEQPTQKLPSMPLYTLSGDEQEVLFQYHGRERDIVIPPDMGLKRIGSHAFSGSRNNVGMPEDFTEPFCNWMCIRSVVIPEGVTTIEFAAFKGCTNLQSVTLPSTLTYIGGCAFEGCTSLRDVELPDALRTISISAFGGCTSLNKLELQRTQGKLQVGYHAFWKSGITSLAMTGNISLEEGCFQECTQLERVTILDCNGDTEQPAPQATTSDRIGLETLPDSTFEQCTSLRSVRLPSTLQSVGSKAFAGCEALRSIGLPNGIREIGTEAFSGCSSLWTIRIPEHVETIKTETFSRCKMLSKVSLSGELKTIESLAFKKCVWLESIDLPASLEELAPRAFEGCERLSKAAIFGGDCHGTFYRSAFAGCPVRDEPDLIANLPSTATLANDAAYPKMFDGPSQELRAVRFDTRFQRDRLGDLRGFFVVDRGVEGLNSFSGGSTFSESVTFWVKLNDGCDRGYCAVKGTTSTSRPASLLRDIWSPKATNIVPTTHPSMSSMPCGETSPSTFTTAI